LDVIGTKVVSFPSVTSVLTNFTLPRPLSKSGLNLICKVTKIWYSIHEHLNSRLCPETSMKLYVHELSFWTGEVAQH
jgi:hypothetical protein